MLKISAFMKDPFNRIFLLTFVGINLFKIWAITLFPITWDESYYWLWHKHLAFSYVDHPPFIAWFNKLVSLFGEYNLFHFRLSGIILAWIATWFVFKIGESLFNQKTGIIAATLFQLIPHFIIIWLNLTMDNPLALFWIMALYFSARIVKKGNPTDWYWLGIVFGFGLLTKYTMAFFVLPLFLLLLFNNEQRIWLKRREPYLALALSALIFSPVIIWNFQHHFISFLFHASRLGKEASFQNLLAFIADQLIHFSPFLFLGIIIFWKQIWKGSQFLFFFSIPLLIMFISFTFSLKVWANWATTYQFAAIIGIASLVSPNPKTAKRLIVSMWFFALIAVSLVLFGSQRIFPRQDLYKLNYLLADKYAALPRNTYILSPFNVVSSQLAFYSHQQTFVAQGALKIEAQQGFGLPQFALWGNPIKKGDNVVYFGPENDETLIKLNKYFTSVEIKKDLNYYAIESYFENLVPYYCKGLKESILL